MVIESVPNVKTQLADSLSDFVRLGEDYGWDAECVVAQICDRIDDVESTSAAAAVLNLMARELKDRYVS